jgi:hypothetical protein
MRARPEVRDILIAHKHDFNQYVWPPEWSLDADAHGKVLSVIREAQIADGNS